MYVICNIDSIPDHEKGVQQDELFSIHVVRPAAPLSHDRECYLCLHTYIYLLSIFII